MRQSLLLANNLSPAHAMQWLVITDKVRLLAELLNRLPTIETAELKLIDKDSQENPHFNFKQDMNMRFNQLCTETINWLNL